MDMKINSTLIVTLRKERGWSQQQLSVASGVSIRTVQRVENEGNASIETMKSLAGAFDTDFRSLQIRHTKPKRFKSTASKYFFLIVSLISTLVITSATTAATSVQVRSESVVVSSDQRTTTFSGGVVLTIPDETAFEITVDKAHLAVGQMLIRTEETTFIATDAKIERVNRGIQISAAQVSVNNPDALGT